MCSGNKSCLAHQTEFIYKLSTNYILFEILSLKEKSFCLQPIRKIFKCLVAKYRYSHAILQNFAFRIGIRKHFSHLSVGIHSIIDYTKTAIDTSAILFPEQYIKIFIFVNLVCFPIHTFATELVFGSKYVIGFGT